MRWLAVVAGLVLAALVVNFSRCGAEFRRFLELSRIELRKVVWPTRDETIKVTIAVFVFVIVAGVFFWALDLFLAWATRFLTTPGRLNNVALRWYVVHAYSNFEHRVAEALKERIQRAGLERTLRRDPGADRRGRGDA